MFVENPSEDGEQRRMRMHRESVRNNEFLKRMDAENAETQAERVALCQTDNVRLRRPIDYAAIIKYRAERADLFLHLPSDAECRKALGERERPLEDDPINVPPPVSEPDDDEDEDAKPEPTGLQRHTLRLRQKQKTGG